ncbi:MAG: VCBS repeat-containing protein [bacterium]
MAPVSAATLARPALTLTAPAAIQPGIRADLPPSDRVFTAALDPTAGADHLLGARGDQLWAALPTADGRWDVRWVVQGPGAVAQRVALVDLGAGPRLYVAWGVGRGFLQAPLVLQAHDPATGAATEVWRNEGQRNEAADLGVADVDGDGRRDLAFAWFTSKYMVRTRHLTAAGGVVEGPEIRMATSHAFGDLDADGKPDAIVGRVYGDAKGEPGDLTVYFGGGEVVKVPVEQGVKALAVGRIGDDPRDTLYVSDGWVADYGKSARARLSRVTFTGRTPKVDLWPPRRTSSPSRPGGGRLRSGRQARAGGAGREAGQPHHPRTPWTLQPLAASSRS